jgi:hypothetical protein
MKRILSSLLVLCFSISIAQAQLDQADKVKSLLTTENKDTVAWLYTGIASIGLNQGYLHNWAAGGELASLAIDGLFSGNLVRLHHKHYWGNSLDAAYSLIYTYSNHFVPRKVNDRLDFTSKYGYRLDTSKGFYLTGLFNFRTQFTKGYDYTAPEWEKHPISNLLSPGYLTIAAGMEYREGTVLSLFLSPLAFRYTLCDKLYTTVYKDGAFGVPYGETSRTELGAYFSGRFVKGLSKGKDPEKLLFKSRLDLYMNYLAKDKLDSAGRVITHDNPGNIDIMWDNLMVIKLNRFLTLNITLTIIYDNDVPYRKDFVDPTNPNVLIPKDEPGEDLGWWQIREIVAFGFTYKF